MAIALRIIPLDDQWVEVPANAEILDSFALDGLLPTDLFWREAWIEAFLAENATAVASILGYGKPSMVFRQIADMDLAFVDNPSRTVCVLEVKKPGGDHAQEAVCQLARNLERVERAVRFTYPGFAIRPVACGSWSSSQIDRAQNTRAWEQLQACGSEPTFVLYSGARSADGTEFFVMNEGTPPFEKRGRTAVNESFLELRRHAEEIGKQLPSGLRVATYAVGDRAIIRFTAGSQLRDAYLRSPRGARFSGSVVAYLRVQESIEGKTDLFVRTFIGQRLELFVQAKAYDPEFAALHAALVEIGRESLQAGPAG